MATTRRRERPERHPTAQRLLDVVVAMLAALHLADQPLVTAQQHRQIPLPDAPAHAHALEHVEKDLVVTGVKDLGHGLVC